MLDRVSALNPPRRPLRRVDLDSPDHVFLSEMEEDVVLAGSARMEMARTQKGDGNDDDTFYARLSSAVTSLYRPTPPRDEHADARESVSSWEEEEGPVGHHRGEWVELQLSAEAAAHGNIPPPMAPPNNLPTEHEHSNTKTHNSIWVRSTLAFDMYTEEGEAEAEISSDPTYLECKYRLLKSPVPGNNMLEKYRKAKLLSHKVQKTLNKYCGLMEKYKNVLALALALTLNSKP
jgi:hypothetical protein